MRRGALSNDRARPAHRHSGTSPSKVRLYPQFAFSCDEAKRQSGGIILSAPFVPMSYRGFGRETMSDQIAEIKSKMDIAQLINERVSLKQRGRRFLALCPFHSEKTPSFTVSPDLGIFKCFGCGKSGDAFTFLQEYEGMSFVESLEYLAEKTGVKLERRAVDRHTADIDKKIFEINHLAAEYFHYLLTKHKVGERGREYLKSRAVTAAAIDNFFLGYAPDRWDSLFKFLAKKGYSPELLESAGLIVLKA